MDSLHPLYKKTYAAKSGNAKTLGNFNNEIKTYTKPTTKVANQSVNSNKENSNVRFPKVVVEKCVEKKQVKTNKRPLHSSEQEVFRIFYVSHFSYHQGC